MSKASKWEHGTDRYGRFRGGKTASDKKSGAWKSRFTNREKPIRCTSSHVMGGQDNRGVAFWGG